MRLRVATVGLAHPFEIGFEHAKGLLDDTSKALANVEIDVLQTNVVMSDKDTVDKAVNQLLGSDIDLLVICVATWSEDNHLLDLLARVDLPVLIRAFPHRETGSLCCAHQIGAVFTEIGKSYEYVYGDVKCDSCAQDVRQIATTFALQKHLKRMKVGTIGGRVQGMTEIAFDEFAIKEKLGPRVINIDETEMLDEVAAVHDDDAKNILSTFKERDYDFISEGESQVESIKYYLALKKLIEAYDLDCLTVKCYPKYMGKVCLPFSLLAEEGIMCGCEGDVASTIAMQMLFMLSQRSINNTDLLYLDEEKNTALFSHCGSSGFDIAGGTIEIAPVRLANSGCCARFVTMPGRVTLLNIVGHGEKLRMTTMNGEAVPCGMEFPGNPVLVKFEKRVQQINKEIMMRGIGHHWMVGYGDYTDILERLCRLNSIHYYHV